MTIASTEISIYPLRQERLGPAIETVRIALAAHGLGATVGPMSTVVVGEEPRSALPLSLCSRPNRLRYIKAPRAGPRH